MNIDELRDAIESLRSARAELSVTLVQWLPSDDPLLAENIKRAKEFVGAAISDIDAWIDDNYDPTPYCSRCGARERKNCDCGPIASNE